MNNLNFKHWILIQVLFFGICSILLLSLTSISPTLFIFDYWFGIDQAYRLKQGLMPYRDIYTSIGPFYYLSIYLFLKLNFDIVFIPAFLGILWIPLFLLLSKVVFNLSKNLYVLLFHMALCSWAIGPVYEFFPLQSVWMAPYTSFCYPILFAFICGLFNQKTSFLTLGFIIILFFGLKINYAFISIVLLAYSIFYHKSFKNILALTLPVLFLLSWFIISNETFLGYFSMIKEISMVTQNYDFFRLNTKFSQSLHSLLLPMILIVILPVFWIEKKRDLYFVLFIFVILIFNSLNDFQIFSPTFWMVGIFAIIFSRVNPFRFFYTSLSIFILLSMLISLSFQHVISRNTTSMFNSFKGINNAVTDYDFTHFLDANQTIYIPPELKVVFGTFAQMNFLNNNPSPKTLAWFDYGRTLSNLNISMRYFDADAVIVSKDKGKTGVLIKDFIEKNLDMCKDLRSWIVYSKDCTNPLIDKIEQRPTMYKEFME